MNIHEYQGKAMFKRYGVPVLEGVHCTSPDEALAAYDQLGSKVVAVKSQIHAGGRGKGNLYAPDSGDLVMEGGVKIAFSREEVGTYASNILGNVLVTIQTGDEGKLVRNLYVESGCAIAHEYYLALLVDREAKSVLIMASTEGGMDIEDVAEATPELIHKIHVDPSAGLLGFQSRDLADALGLSGAAAKAFRRTLGSLYTCFVENDCAMVEINPLVRTEDDGIVALDAKVSFDENASFRHAATWDELRDLSEEEETEIRALKPDFPTSSWTATSGAWSTALVLPWPPWTSSNSRAENLRISSTSVVVPTNEEQVTTAFSIILEDPNVKGILVNIFGGIMRCDIIARGVIAAVRNLGLEVPLVVRLAGTNVDEGKAILETSDLNIHPANTLAEGAQRIVALIGGDA